jgi:hypothetical protein
MCIICIDLDKNKISPWEAKRNLTEMVENIGPEHTREVENKISDLIYSQLYINYGDTVHDTIEECGICDADPCFCDWGTCE